MTIEERAAVIATTALGCLEYGYDKVRTHETVKEEAVKQMEEVVAIIMTAVGKTVGVLGFTLTSNESVSDNEN